MKLSENTLWSKRSIDDLNNYVKNKDLRNLKKVLDIVKSIQRDPDTQVLKSEALKGNRSGSYSLRINKKDRFVYRIVHFDNTDVLEVIQCRSHYD